MTSTASHALTLICGAWLGMLGTIIVIGLRDVWRNRHCTCEAEALELHSPDCPLYKKSPYNGIGL